MTRLCAWCENPIPLTARRDAVCCSVRCRQARHRFLRAVGQAEVVAPGRSLRLAYADPPYPARRGCTGITRTTAELDHTELIERLAVYDGRALSTSAAALPSALALCPPGVRVAARYKGERVTRSRYPLSAWEPVIYHGGRQLPGPRRADSIACGVTPVSTVPGRVIGAKPAAVCRWIFTLLGAGPGDTLDDLFPGSGAVSRAWAAYTSGEASRHGYLSFQARAYASSPAAADGYHPVVWGLTRRLSPALRICPVTARTVQGMARVRSGQAPAWPLVSDRSVRRGSGVKRDFACTFTRHLSPVLVALRSQ